MPKKKKLKVKSLSKARKININDKNTMNITKIVLTETDGTVTESTISTAVSGVVATLEDGSTVTLFPSTGTPVPAPTPTVTVPLGTPVIIEAA